MADDRRNFLKQVAAGILGSGVRIGAGISAVSAWTGAQTNCGAAQSERAGVSGRSFASKRGHVEFRNPGRRQH